MKRLLFAFVFCLLLVLTYALLTNSVIYQKTFQNVAKNWTCVNGEKYLVEKPFTVPDSTNYFQGDGKFFKFIKRCYLFCRWIV